MENELRRENMRLRKENIKKRKRRIWRILKNYVNYVEILTQ